MTSQSVVKSKAHFIQAKFTGTMTYNLQKQSIEEQIVYTFVGTQDGEGLGAARCGRGGGSSRGRAD
jgi:hypothetical protein